MADRRRQGSGRDRGRGLDRRCRGPGRGGRTCRSRSGCRRGSRRGAPGGGAGRGCGVRLVPVDGRRQAPCRGTDGARQARGRGRVDQGLGFGHRRQRPLARLHAGYRAWPGRAAHRVLRLGRTEGCVVRLHEQSWRAPGELPGRVRTGGPWPTGLLHKAVEIPAGPSPLSQRAPPGRRGRARRSRCGGCR